MSTGLDGLEQLICQPESERKGAITTMSVGASLIKRKQYYNE